MTATPLDRRTRIRAVWIIVAVLLALGGLAWRASLIGGTPPNLLVVDPSGRPVAGAGVWIEWRLLGTTWPGSPPTLLATGPDGRIDLRDELSRVHLKNWHSEPRVRVQLPGWSSGEFDPRVADRIETPALGTLEVDIATDVDPAIREFAARHARATLLWVDGSTFARSENGEPVRFANVAVGVPLDLQPLVQGTDLAARHLTIDTDAEPTRVHVDLPSDLVLVRGRLTGDVDAALSSPGMLHIATETGERRSTPQLDSEGDFGFLMCTKPGPLRFRFDASTAWTTVEVQAGQQVIDVGDMPLHPPR